MYRVVKGLSGGVVVAVLLSACGGGGGGGGAGAYAIGGSVSGLGPGAAVVLQQNDGDDVSISSNGSFRFATPVPGGSNYRVTVKTQPNGQTCSVTNGSGTVTGEVTDVSVSCASGSGQPPTTPSTPTMGVDGVVGEWLQSLCVQASSGTGNRLWMRVTKTGDASISFDRGVMTYAATDCSGAGAPLDSPTPMGDVTLFRTEATSTLAANWGLWTYPSGQAYSVWAKKGETILCLFADTNPSVFPTVAEVEGHADLVNQGHGCYFKK